MYLHEFKLVAFQLAKQCELTHKQQIEPILDNLQWRIMTMCKGDSLPSEQHMYMHHKFIKLGNVSHCCQTSAQAFLHWAIAGSQGAFCTCTVQHPPCRPRLLQRGAVKLVPNMSHTQTTSHVLCVGFSILSANTNEA